MSTAAEDVNFEALDACHQQVLEHLKDLAALAEQMRKGDLDAPGMQRAAAIEKFFSSTSRQHHADEEKTVFPLLLQSEDAQLVTAVQTLQQDHGWIETNWSELSPQLRAIATGMGWPDLNEFGAEVKVFVELCRDHIALEETLIYPESKARWEVVVKNRASRPPVATGQSGRSSPTP